MNTKGLILVTATVIAAVIALHFGHKILSPQVDAHTTSPAKGTSSPARSTAINEGRINSTINAPHVAEAPHIAFAQNVRQLALGGKSPFAPSSVNELKKNADKSYFELAPNDLLSKAATGDLTASILAAEVLRACRDKGADGLSHCKQAGDDILRKEIKLLLSAAEFDKSIDMNDLSIAAYRLSRYSTGNAEDGGLVNRALDLLHKSAQMGNSSAISALASSYSIGGISGQSPLYSLLFLSMLDDAHSMSKFNGLPEKSFSSMRPGDRISVMDYASKFRSGSLVPIYKFTNPK